MQPLQNHYVLLVASFVEAARFLGGQSFAPFRTKLRHRRNWDLTELGFDRLRCAMLCWGVLVEVRKQGVAGLIFRGASEARAKGAAADSAEVAEGSPAQAAGGLG
jgi:hypothetical protein